MTRDLVGGIVVPLTTLRVHPLGDKARQDARRRVPGPVETLHRCARPTNPRHEPSEQRARARSAPSETQAAPIQPRSTASRQAKVSRTPVAQNPLQDCSIEISPSSPISVSACHCQKRTDGSAPTSRMMSKTNCGSPSNNDANHSIARLLDRRLAEKIVMGNPRKPHQAREWTICRFFTPVRRQEDAIEQRRRSLQKIASGWALEILRPRSSRFLQPRAPTFQTEATLTLEHCDNAASSASPGQRS